MVTSTSHATTLDHATSTAAATVNFSQLIQPENCKFVDEPDLKDDRALIWKYQVLIPSTNTYAFLRLGKIVKNLERFSLATTNLALGYSLKVLM
jgi:hypothetical protein